MQNILFGPLSIFPPICIVAIALLSIAVFSKIKQFELQPVKYEAFDGLKGYLSMIVFICHSSTWFYYLRTEKWTVPPSNLYSQIGQTSISFFFMMTGFLFCNKLIDGKTNWLKLYTSRLVRLVPLYFIAMFCLFFIIAYLTHFSLNANQSWLTITSQLKKWLMFTIKKDPDINGVPNTWIILCRVTWTLRYEWIFYLALPIISIIFPKNKPDYLAVILSSIVIFFILFSWNLPLIYFTPFIGGITATLLSKSNNISRLALHKTGSFILFILIVILMLSYEFTPISAYELFPFLMISTMFILIISGNTFFGILSISAIRKLGQLSYGIYLFHGILFFILFKFILGFEQAASLSSLQHWVYIFLLTPILVLISFLLHIYVEVPALLFTPVLYKKINDSISIFKQKIFIEIKS